MSTIALAKKGAKVKVVIDSGLLSVYANPSDMNLTYNSGTSQVTVAFSTRGGSYNYSGIAIADITINEVAITDETVFDEQVAILFNDSIGSLTELDVTNKDKSSGYPGLTLFKINFKNAANTFTSFFTNANTAARTYTFQNRNGTIADDTDLALKQGKLDVASDFADDAAAASGGIAIGSLYHTSGAVKIRLA